MRAWELPRHGGAPGHPAWRCAGPHRQSEQVRWHRGHRAGEQTSAAPCHQLGITLLLPCFRCTSRSSSDLVPSFGAFIAPRVSYSSFSRHDGLFDLGACSGQIVSYDPGNSGCLSACASQKHFSQEVVFFLDSPSLVEESSPCSTTVLQRILLQESQLVQLFALLFLGASPHSIHWAQPNQTPSLQPAKIFHYGEV